MQPHSSPPDCFTLGNGPFPGGFLHEKSLLRWLIMILYIMAHIPSQSFLTSVLNTLPEQIAVIDMLGDIHYVNNSWIDFGEGNNGPSTNWEQMNYLAVCEAATKDAVALTAAGGIRAVLEGETDRFQLEYPCHSPEEKRWFIMRAALFSFEGKPFVVVSHQNITSRKIAEEKALTLSRTDPITKLANRRYFDEFLESEWKRCDRLGLPITLGILDIDNFKKINDTYGHQVGDDYLRKLGEVVVSFIRRPTDLAARIGGDEIALVFGNTSVESHNSLGQELINAIEKIDFSDGVPVQLHNVTVSIGLASAIPKSMKTLDALIRISDELMYAAKRGGGDQYVSKIITGS